MENVKRKILTPQRLAERAVARMKKIRGEVVYEINEDVVTFYFLERWDNIVVSRTFTELNKFNTVKAAAYDIQKEMANKYYSARKN